MLTFLTTPYFWLGLAAASIPVIIHLILRNRAEIVHFAAMRFLAATPKKLLRRQRLKQIILLAMRILALLILGAAFARPLLTGKDFGGLLAQEPRALAIIVDVSASMAANHHLDKAKAKAQEIIDKANKGDQISVIAAAATSELLAENADPGAAKLSLQRIGQRHSSGKIREAVQFADNLLRQSPLRRRQIYFVSDLQSSNLTLGNLALTSAAEFTPVEVGPTWQNVGIVGAERLERDGKVTYVCRIRSHASNNQEVFVRLVIDPETGLGLGQRRLSISANSEQTMQFASMTGNASTASSGAAYFELNAPLDDFQTDNRYYLAPASSASHRLLLIEGNTGASFFVRKALELPGSPYRLFVASPNLIERYELQDFEAILLIGASGVNRLASEKLLDYVTQGGGLILSVPANLSIEAFNQLFGELLPGKLIESQSSGAAQPQAVALTEIDFGHPIFKVFRDPANGDPSAVQLTSYHRVEPRPGAAQLAALEDGQPALLERSVGKGKVLMWTSSLDLSGNNLPVRSIFVPLMHQWVEYVRRAQTPNAMNRVGQPILFDEELLLGRTVEVTWPDRKQDDLTLSTPAFMETSLPGHYRFKQGKKEFWRAVNLDERESDPASSSPENLAARFHRPDEAAEIAGVFGSSEPTLREHEKQQKLWRWAMWGLLALLLGESWLANRTPR